MRSLKSLGLALASAMVAAVLSSAPAAAAVDYTLDCDVHATMQTGDTRFGLTWTATNTDYYTTNVYLGGIVGVTQTVRLENCDYAVARNQYPNNYVSPNPGEFLSGVAKEYTVTVPIGGSYGDVWGQNRNFGGYNNPPVTYIINFYNNIDPASPAATSNAMTGSAATISDGESLTFSNTVTATGTDIDPVGVVANYYCFDAVSTPTCDSGGTYFSLSPIVSGTANDATITASSSWVPTMGPGFYTVRSLFRDNRPTSLFAESINTVSFEVLPAVAPGAPGTPVATAGSSTIDLTWTAPTTGTPPSYSVTPSPAGPTCTVTGLTASCTNISKGVDYTFTVTATNGGGSATSLESNAAVIPMTLTADVASVAPGEQVQFTTNAGATNLAAIFFDGELPILEDRDSFAAVVAFVQPLSWEVLSPCTTGTLTYRIYATDVITEPTWTTPYAASVDVEWVGDATDPSCATAGSAPAPYTGPVLSSFSTRTLDPCVATAVTITGSNLSGAKPTIQGKEITVLENTDTKLVLAFPSGLEAAQGEDLIVASSSGTLRFQNAFDIPAETCATAVTKGRWTQLQSDGKTVKMYAKDPIGDGKIQFFVDGKEIAWINAVDEADPKLSFASGNPYLVRSVELKPGKNRFEIRLDGVRVWRATYVPKG